MEAVDTTVAAVVVEAVAAVGWITTVKEKESITLKALLHKLTLPVVVILLVVLLLLEGKLEGIMNEMLGHLHPLGAVSVPVVMVVVVDIV